MALVQTHGPDCSSGPKCCCDPCTHVKLGCADECCFCVPRVMCAVFIPYEETDECFPVYSFMENEGSGGYEGNLRNIRGYGTDTPITMNLQGSLATPESPCAWRVQIPDLGIDETYEIDGEYVTCGDPSFTLDKPGGCPGVIEITRYDPAKVPFQRDDADDDLPDEVDLYFPCGDCTTVCRVICVQYYHGVDEFGEPILIRTPMGWNADNRLWEHPNGDQVSLVEDYETGRCTLVPNIENLGGAQAPIELPYEQCTGLGLNVESDYGVRISCNGCSCWEYLCGTCRCACQTLCVFRQRDWHSFPELLELEWNGSGWGADYDLVSLSRDPATGNCIVTVEGFDSFVLEDCGTGVDFSLDDGEGHRVFAKCKACGCFQPPSECCGTELHQLPLVLVATITNVQHCSCADGAVIYLMYIPTGNFWSGYGPTGCFHCPGPGPGTIDFNNPKIISLSIPCGAFAGLGGIEGETADPNNTCNPLFLEFHDVIFDDSECECEPSGVGGGVTAGTLTITITE